MKLSDQITRRHLFVAFGTSSQTGSLSSVDLAATRDDASVALTASDGSVAPIAGADAFAAGVMTAADKTRLDNLPPTTTRDFGILSEVPGVTVRAAITHLRTAGRFAPGDGGGALYRRATAEPSHAFKIQSGEGAWWEGVPDKGWVDVHQFGAKGDDTTDDTTAIQNAIDYAVDNKVAVKFLKNKTYKVTNLTVTTKQNLVLLGDGFDNDGTHAATLKYYGAAGGTMLYLKGIVGGYIDGLTLKYGNAAPDAYIKTDNDPLGSVFNLFTVGRLLIMGNGKTDGSVGLDLGPNSTTHNSEMDFSWVTVKTIQTGIRYNQNQTTGMRFGTLRLIGCGTGFDAVDGGSTKIGTFLATGTDLCFKIRGSGGNGGGWVIDNAHAEWGAANAAAVFLDVASTTAGGIKVVLNGPVIQQNYTGTIVKVGKAATVICNGGQFRSGTIDLQGTKDEGDAVFLGIGMRFQSAITTNDFGYYRVIAPTRAISGGDSPFIGHFTGNRGNLSLDHDLEKMPVGNKRYFTMPIAKVGGGTVHRHLPVGAIVTRLDFVIENVGLATATDLVRITMGGVNLAEIVFGTAGPRHFGWRTNDLDAGDTSFAALGDPGVLAGLDSNQHIAVFRWSGSAANIATVTGQMIVEYVVESVRTTGLDL